MGLTMREKVELEQLLMKKGLYSLSDSTNPNYRFVFDALKEQKFDQDGELIGGKAGVIMEGGSRSGKTWSWVDVVVYICLFVEKSCEINIYRETFEEFKTTIYSDFKRRLDDFGIPNKFHDADRIKNFKIGKNKINFLGCDKLSKAHGGGCDYAIFNEMMHIPYDIFNHVEQRCRRFWIGDYNPSVTQHWVFDKVLKRSDVGYIHTTLLDNPHITFQEKRKLLSYEPWRPGSYKVHNSVVYYRGKEVDETHQPPPHPKNVDAGTDDEYYWRVYGLGLRGAMTGIIFKNVTYIDKFPNHVDYIHANDFGFTADPNATVKYAEDENNIWIELLVYTPIETVEALDGVLSKLGIERDRALPCDSSDKYTGENKGTVEMVRGLRSKGWSGAFKISKKKSIMYWLLSMKSKKIHIIKNHLYTFAKKEQENYVLKEVGGIAINQPEDKYNHFWDAARYGHMSYNGCGERRQTAKSLKDMGIAY